MKDRLCILLFSAVSALSSFAQTEAASLGGSVPADSVAFAGGGDSLVWHVSFVDSLVCYAESFLGTPYRYGAKGPDAFDCSGFTGFVFSHFGIPLPASSTAQYQAAPDKVEDNCPAQGDLIFFMGRNGRRTVGHVGIVVDFDSVANVCRFIHAATHGGVILTNYPSSAYYNQRFMGYGRYPLPELLAVTAKPDGNLPPDCPSEAGEAMAEEAAEEAEAAE